MLDEKAISDRILNLKAQRDQAVITLYMIDGALQVLEDLLKSEIPGQPADPEQSQEVKG